MGARLFAGWRLGGLRGAAGFSDPAGCTLLLVLLLSGRIHGLLTHCVREFAESCTTSVESTFDEILYGDAERVA